MLGFDQLPPELFYQIGLHLPYKGRPRCQSHQLPHPRSIVNTGLRQGTSSITRVGGERLGR